MGTTDRYETALSPGQARFAVEHDAHASVSCRVKEPEVYLYREAPWATYRWLVDRSGDLLEAEIFRKSPRQGSFLSCASEEAQDLARFTP
jgi:hypothetical protein